ncbi:hypothetical protein [Halovulum marinum]|nr:hypothetical protein [Halovulum marinum]
MVAVNLRPGATRLVSAIQHLAAGVVFAAAMFFVSFLLLLSLEEVM